MYLTFKLFLECAERANLTDKFDLSDIPQDKNLYTKENTFETVKDIVEYIQSFK